MHFEPLSETNNVNVGANTRVGLLVDDGRRFTDGVCGYCTGCCKNDENCLRSGLSRQRLNTISEWLFGAPFQEIFIVEKNAIHLTN